MLDPRSLVPPPTNASHHVAAIPRSIRWCRVAQPPANGCDAFSIMRFGCLQASIPRRARRETASARSLGLSAHGRRNATPFHRGGCTLGWVPSAWAFRRGRLGVGVSLIGSAVASSHYVHRHGVGGASLRRRPVEASRHYVATLRVRLFESRRDSATCSESCSVWRARKKLQR